MQFSSLPREKAGHEVIQNVINVSHSDIGHGKMVTGLTDARKIMYNEHYIHSLAEKKTIDS